MESGTVETATILPRLPQSLAVQLFAGATPHHLKAGEALFMVGGSGDGCYRLEQGLLKVVITSPRGDNRILAVLGPGSIAGELALIDGLPALIPLLHIYRFQTQCASSSDSFQAKLSPPHLFGARNGIFCRRD